MLLEKHGNYALMGWGVNWRRKCQRINDFSLAQIYWGGRCIASKMRSCSSLFARQYSSEPPSAIRIAIQSSPVNLTPLRAPHS